MKTCHVFSFAFQFPMQIHFLMSHEMCTAHLHEISCFFWPSPSTSPPSPLHLILVSRPYSPNLSEKERSEELRTFHAHWCCYDIMNIGVDSTYSFSPGLWALSLTGDMGNLLATTGGKTSNKWRLNTWRVPRNASSYIPSLDFCPTGMLPSTLLLVHKKRMVT